MDNSVVQRLTHLPKIPSSFQQSQLKSGILGTKANSVQTRPAYDSLLTFIKRQMTRIGSHAAVWVASRQTGSLVIRHFNLASVFVKFFAGQGMLQTVNAIVGIYLVRSLTVEAYGQLGLAFAFQTTVEGLMSCGLSTTLVPLIGNRGANLRVVGAYVRAARSLRKRAFLVIAPVASAIFLYMTHSRGWNWQLQVPLLASVLVSLYASAQLAYFSVPLLINSKLGSLYMPQAIAAMGRGLLVAAFNAAGWLTSCTASLLNSANTYISGFLVRKNGQNLLEWPEDDDPGTQKEIIRYLLPAVPVFAFSALQGQLALLLISVSGKTSSIAQVAVIARMTQLFAIFGTFNTVVIEPRMARCSYRTFQKRYLILVPAATVLCISVVLLAFRFPSTPLILIGKRYGALADLSGWVVLSTSISYLAGLLMTMNRARKWIFWSGTIFEIAAIVIVQSSFLLFVGVRTTKQAVFFALCTACCHLATHSYVSILGFWKGRLAIVDPIHA